MMRASNIGFPRYSRAGKHNDGAGKLDAVNQDLTSDDALALDYALGILHDDDRRAVRERMSRDAAFALLVMRNQRRLSVEGDDGANEDWTGPSPSLETWDAILSRIGQVKPC